MDFLKVAVIILFVILTILTIRIHPEIHQPMLIEDANFKLTRIADTIPTQNIPTTAMTTPQKVVQQQQTSQPAQTVEVKITEPVSKTTVELPKKQVQIPKATQTQQVSPDQSQLELLEQIIKAAQEIEQVQTPIEKPIEKPVKTVTPQSKQTVTQPVTHSNPYMTEQEELIAWNKWRSNIHNQVMKDSNAGSAPFGTLFIFSFLVDKYGNISNIKVDCSNNYCMDIARNNLKPAIANLQRKPILNFPRGTHRTSVVVSGSFLIGTEDRFSTPGHFSDIERVVH